jgi:hypothetical protein
MPIKKSGFDNLFGKIGSKNNNDDKGLAADLQGLYLTRKPLFNHTSRDYAAGLTAAAKTGFWGSVCQGKIPEEPPEMTRIPR